MWRCVERNVEVQLQNFQQLTEIWWLSKKRIIKRILKQWEAVIQFVAVLAKEPRKVPMGINYKTVYMMLGTKEKIVTRVTHKFLNTDIYIFESFYCSSREVVDIHYDSTWNVLVKHQKV